MTINWVRDIILALGLIPYTAFTIWFARDVYKQHLEYKDQKFRGKKETR